MYMYVLHTYHLITSHSHSLYKYKVSARSSAMVHAVYYMTGIHVCMCTIGDYTLHVRVVCSAVLILVLTCTCSRGRARLSLMWLV